MNKFKSLSDYTPGRSAALFMLVVTAALWSLGGILIKFVSLNPIAIAGMRSLIAAIIILFFIKKPDFRFTPIKVASAFVYAATVMTFVIATKLTTAANAIVLQYTAPIYVAFFGAVFLKEKVRWYDILTILFVFGGMVLFFFDKLSTGGLLGNIIAVVSGVAFAFVALLLRLQRDESPLDRIFWGNILTFLVSVPFLFKTKPDTGSIIGIVLLGTVQLGFSYIIYSVAIKNVTALEAVLIPMIEPILNPIWVALFLKEVPGIFSLVGGLTVIGAVAIRCVYTYIKSKKYISDPSSQEFVG
jgi:drug/metabolite transporter (DMT)-like permease